MPLSRGLFTSTRPDWETPADVFTALNREFGPFSLDPCATPKTAKCARFYQGIEGLMLPWFGRVFVNPPYGRDIGKWIQRCWGVVQEGDAEIVVALIPSRTDTHWWHEWVMRANEIRFLRGRLKFSHPDYKDAPSHSAPFPSCVVVWRTL